MLDQIQPRTDTAPTTVASERVAVSGQTGLNQGQTALAVVQIAQGSAADNQAASDKRPDQATQTAGRNTYHTAPSSGQHTALPAGNSNQASPQVQTHISSLAIANISAASGPQQTVAGIPVAEAHTGARTADATAPQRGSEASQTASQIATPQRPVTTITNTARLIQLLTSNSNSAAGHTVTSGTQIFIPDTGRTVRLHINTLPSGSQLLLRQGPGQQIDILRAQIPASSAAAISVHTTASASRNPSSATTASPTLTSSSSAPLAQAGGQAATGGPGSSSSPQSTESLISVRHTQASNRPQAQAQPSLLSTHQPNIAIQQANLSAAVKTMMHNALRQSLPLQQPTGTVLQQLHTLLPQLQPTLLQQPSLQQALNTLNNAPLQFPEKGIPDAQQVRQHIERSGVFHEAILMQTLQQIAQAGTHPVSALVSNDLKGAFFQLFRLLNRLPGEQSSRENASRSATDGPVPEQRTAAVQHHLARALQEGLARIRSHQLQSRSSGRGADTGAGVQLLQTDLPIMIHNQLASVSISIEQRVPISDQDQQQSGDEYQKSWRINLTLSPPDLGKIHAQLNYQQDKLAARIWVEQNASLPEISRQLYHLKERLSQLGITVDELRCDNGRPEFFFSQSVMDIQA